jgi:FkbM family methyltransferase
MLLETNPQLRVICFEPLGELTTSLASDQRVQVHNCVIGSYTGVTTLHVNQDDPTQSSLFRLTPETKPLEVAQRTLDEFCLENGIDHVDFCKIDTEGSELDVLRGAISLVKRSAIRMIQFEYGGTYQDARASLREIYDLLSEQYIICHLLRCGLLPLAYSPEIETYRYSNWVALSRALYQKPVS